MRGKLGLLFAVSLLAGRESAIAAETKTSPLDWLASHGVQIRKSFVGSVKEAAAPATLTYENPDGGPSFYSYDLGLKVGQIPWNDDFGSGSWSGRVFPSLELHRASGERDPVNKRSFALTLELERGLNRDSEGDLFSRMLYVDLKAETSRDSIQQQTSRAVVGRIGYYDAASEWAPGSDILIGQDESMLFVWLPTLLIEDYRRLPIKAKVGGQSVVIADSVDVSTAAVRVNLLFSPLRNLLDSRLAVTANVTYRERLSGDRSVQRDSRLIELSADYYLDEARRLAIGVSYQRGEDPARNFLDEEFSSVGLKLKIDK